MPQLNMNKPKRNEIWELQFNPTIGAEMQKVRPALVMNPSEIGKLPLFIVVPITDWKTDFKSLPWFFFLPPTSENGLKKESAADAFQVKSVSEKRFIRKLGELTDQQTNEIAAGIALCVGYNG